MWKVLAKTLVDGNIGGLGIVYLERLGNAHVSLGLQDHSIGDVVVVGVGNELGGIGLVWLFEHWWIGNVNDIMRRI